MGYENMKGKREKGKKRCLRDQQIGAYYTADGSPQDRAVRDNLTRLTLTSRLLSLLPEIISRIRFKCFAFAQLGII